MNYTPAFLDMVGKIQKTAPKSETKEMDFMAIAAMIMKFIEFIISFWKQNKPNQDLQTMLKSMNFIQRFFMKQQIKSQFGKKAWKDGIFTRTLDETGSMSYDQLSEIVKKDMKLSIRI
jgi:hypothetical protein